MADIKETQPRQPIVAVMGHVDHGKTSLLDYIRKTVVASKEAGGITQSVGAYEIEHNGKKITFIDTPGHEAFAKMRERGANAADLAILCIAAEESVKPQTKEVIKTLEATKTPFVVAITKIDKPGADVERVKNDLMTSGVFLEGYGGDVSYEPISSKTGENVDKLLDLVLLASEVAGVSADFSAPAKGFILETRLNKNRGIEVTVILRDGTLKRGDSVGTPSAKGKVKFLENFLGKTVDSVIAGAPAVIVGFEVSPKIGEEFVSGCDVDNTCGATVEGKNLPTVGTGKKPLAMVLKASDSGSLEALSEIVRALPLPKPVMILSESVGEVGEGDLKTAIAGGAIIIAFRSKLDRAAKNLAEAREVKIVSSDIIYELIKAIEESAKNIESGELVGDLEVLAVFNSAKMDKQVVGGKVTEGIFKNKGPFEVKRDNELVGHGKITNLQTMKKDIITLPEGQEGGLMVSADIMIAQGDHLQIRDKKEIV